MPKITEIEISRQYLVAIGYENAKFGLTVKAQLLDDEDFDTVYADLSEQIDDKLSDEIAAFSADDKD